MLYMCTHIQTHTLEISHRKNEILQFKTTWMDLEGVILSEISQRETHALYDFTYMWNLKTETNEQT